MRIFPLISMLLFVLKGKAQIDTLESHTKSKLDTKEFRDTCNWCFEKGTIANYNLIKTDGYFICFYYTNGVKYFNFNILFVPQSNITDKVINNITKHSTLSCKNKMFFETYQLSGLYIKDFEKLFSVSWVIKNSAYHGYNDTLERINKYNAASSTVLFSEANQFTQNKLNVKDSLAIVFKCISINATLQLQAYNKCTQKNLFNIYYNTSEYSKQDNTKRFYVNNKMSWYRLDYRLISPILADVVLMEFNDKVWRKRAANTYKWRRKVDKKELERNIKRSYSNS